MKWLMLRGLVREQRHWGDFARTFESALKEVDPKSETFKIDFPGFGTEFKRKSPASLSAIVADTRNRWLQLRKSGDEWSIFAISLGGMVALQWLKEYPDDFKKVVLVNSSLPGINPLFKRMMPSNYPRILSLLFKSEIAIRERKILEMTTNLQGAELINRAREFAGFALPVRKKDALSQIYAAVRFTPPEKVTIPMLVLNGEGDRLVDPDCSTAIAKFYGGKLVQHPTANHDLPMDEPNWVANQVKQWLQSSL